MKALLKIGIMACVALFSAHANPYIYLDELTLELDSVTLYNGAPVEVISQDGEKSKVKINGYASKDEPNTLYATPNLKVILAQTKESLHVNENMSASLEAEIQTSLLEEDIESVWGASMDEFYNTCTQCHAANEPHLHTMLEWDGLYGSMKEFAKPSPEQDELILRFLRAFASDGFMKFDY